MGRERGRSLDMVLKGLLWGEVDNIPIGPILYIGAGNQSSRVGGGILTSSVAGGHAGGLTQNWRQRGRRRGEKTTKTFVIGSNWKEKLEIKVGVSMQSSYQFPGWKEKVHV